MLCGSCDGEGIVCDECRMKGRPIRLVEGMELCQECAEALSETMDKENG